MLVVKTRAAVAWAVSCLAGGPGGLAASSTLISGHWAVVIRRRAEPGAAGSKETLLLWLHTGPGGRDGGGLP